MNTLGLPEENQWTDLELRQMMLEQEAVSLGQQRYQKNLQKHVQHGNMDMTLPARQIISRTLRTLSEAIETDRSRPVTRGRMRIAVKTIQGIPSEVLAYITLRSALGLVAQETTWTVASSRLGRMCQEEARMQQYSEEAPDTYNITQIALQRKAMRASYINIAQTHRSAETAGLELVSWSRDEVVHVGSYLLDLLCRSTGLFTEKLVTRSRNKTVRMFLPCEQLSEWLEDAHDALADLSPVRLPMVYPPKDWTTPWNGGYLTDLGGPVSLVKTRNQEYLKTLEQVDMPDVYDAVNTLQRVRWQINAPVLQVALELWREGIAAGPDGDESMPPRRDLVRPPVPNQWEGRVHEWKAKDPDAFKKWCRKAAETHQENDRRFAKRIACQATLKVAERFQDEPVIYFPYALDFRGRSYPITANLQPQGNDMAKGLLRFADGKPLGAAGAWWLKIHIANCFGVDKVSLEDRVQWTTDHSDELLDSGLNPLDGDRLWLTAEEPFQALAACMEYAGYMVQGEDYVSKLPVGQDGSCNGLQNFSAMLKDSVGGKATNLVPSKAPEDIYTEVLSLVKEQIRQDAEAGKEEAIKLDGHVSRKLVKQPVMTLPYGATKNGMRRQIEVAVRKMGNPMAIRGDQMWNVCGYLADVTYDAIGRVVVAAVSAMGWLQDVAKLAASDSLPVSWVSPIGLPVLQEYRKHEGKPLRVHISGKQCKLFVAETGTKLDRRKQSLGIAPNFVHSCDASHMMLTTLYLKANQIEHIAMVHDSYAVHACDVPVLNTALRKAFIDMYSEPVLERFKADVAAQLPPEVAEQLPDVPQPGDLDLELVMESDYFFA